jgi:hypothetical protein
MRITFDTNLLGEARLLELARVHAYDVVFVSVSNREVEGTSFEEAAKGEAIIDGISVWGESRWGEGTWGDDGCRDCFEVALRIISAGSFPPKGSRDNLSSGQRRQLRDAMIFCSHVRDGRDVFVTCDEKGFIKDGRRERLQAAFSTRILTPSEFLAGLDPDKNVS